MKTRHSKTSVVVWLCVCITATPGILRAAEYYLRAGVITNTLPDGTNVVMWGLAQESGFGQTNGTVTVPGPELVVPPGDSSLTIHLDNDLPEPISIVIPGQIAAMTPVYTNGRVRSFTHETPPANTSSIDYVWSDLSPGTYLYHSGTHPAVQMQMGLYGAMKNDPASGNAYSNTPYDVDVTLLFSEIDPALHEAVATGNYGAGQAMTSTIDYHPEYFLINGQAFTNGLADVFSGYPGDRVLLRFLNAGLETRVPILYGTYLEIIAEDGNPYTYGQERYSVFLPAQKTIDALFTTSNTNYFPIYDRRGGLVNAQSGPGGMLAFLDVPFPPWSLDRDGDGLPDAWELIHNSNPTNVIAGDDDDDDGDDNLHEYIADTDSDDEFSLFEFTDLDLLDLTDGVTQVTFGETSADRVYSLYYSTNLVSGSWMPIATNIPGSDHAMSFLVTNSVESVFYRVDVSLP